MNTATNSIALNNCFVTVDDPDAALGFYRDVLGLAVKQDVSNGDFRWLTLTTASQPELEITISQVGSGFPMSDADKGALGDLMAKGLLSALIFSVDDVDALFEHVRSAGAEVLQEPADQFYGVRDCAFRDPAGNMVRFATDKPEVADLPNAGFPAED
jgi:catechol 2,3-dioxygenase-like lactoylglutathione lyase family enzyme